MRRRVAFGLALLDAAAVLAGISTAWVFWLWLAPNLQHLVHVQLWELFLPNPWMPAGSVYLIGWLFALRQLGLHDPGRMENSVRIISATTRSAVYMTMFTLVVNAVLAERVYPKGLVLPLLAFCWMYLTTARLLIFRLLLRLEAPPTAVSALIVGIGPDAAAMAERIVRDARHVCTVAGHVRTGMSGPPIVAPERILGDIGDIPALVNKYDVRVVILATRTLPREESMRLAVQADRMGLRVLQAPYSWGVVSPRLGFARIGGLDLIDLAGIRYPTLGEQVKRGFDLAAVLSGGALLLPFLLLVGLVIRLGDGGPALYTAKRLGRGGRTFDFFKFRSMVVDADKIKDQLRHQNESDGRLFKMKNDPRVTPIGRFIRKYSIDELPQLLNVLRGEMNLVGPRPLPAEDLAGIEHDPEMRYWFEQRGKVNPGITGLWQVMGRSELGFAEMVRHDIFYIQNWSLWLDLQVLVKTVPAVLRGRGAS
ncbi:MAG: exopolysaccharide biosynthesis polyprenyl glycosylphosphotransferase [Pseudomonadota bacterium]|nr:exopolysaccharide biosynthesis polyprenyl glycosylphosphotransferase [Pseudomonadota bacterium]